MSLEVTDVDPTISYTATAGQTVFPYPFIVLAESDLLVTQNGSTLSLGTHYTVTGEGVEGGGDVTLVTGATLDDAIVISREMPFERDTDYLPAGDFDPDVLDTDLIRIMLMMQQLKRDIARAVDVSEAEGNVALTGLSLLTPAANAMILGTSTTAFSMLALAANRFPARSSSGNVAAKTITDAALALLATAVVPVTASRPIGIACSDETTALTTGTAKVTFRMPYAMTLTAVRATLSTAQTGGTIFTVDINEAGATILSTKLTIDNGEKTSTTAATAAVMSDTALADDAEITIDIDQIGDGTAKGLKIWLIGYPP